MEDERASKESPLSLNYIKAWRIFSSTMFAWPKEKDKGKRSTLIVVCRTLLPVVLGVFLIGNVTYIYRYQHEADFTTRGHLYITLISGIVTIMRSLAPNIKNYDRVADKLFREVHLIHFKHKSEYHLKVNNLVDKFSYYLTIGMVVMDHVAWVVYNLPSIHHNYRVGAFTNNRVENSTPEFTGYYSFPKINQEEMFIPFTLINFYISYVIGTFHCILDLYLSLAVFQIVGHLYILNHDLASIPRPKNKTFIEVYDMPIAVEMFDDEENRQVYKYISECISHHCMIIRFTEEVSTLFGPTIAVSYLFHLFGCCLCLLQVLSGEYKALTNYGVFTFAIFGQLCHISILFEVLRATSEKLIDAVYAVPWECMDVPNRRAVLMLLRRVQTPIRISALGLADVGVQTMLGILKATFSYYTFFSSFN